nr:hypothetical protein [uncultured Desulfobulbus sp.]
MPRMLVMLLLFCVAPAVVHGGPLSIPALATLVGEPATGCDRSQLSLLPKINLQADPPAHTLFRLGESLQIRVVGACATLLDEELSKRDISEAIQLHLDSVAMKGLPVAVQRGDSPKERVIRFHLLRQSEQQDNRNSWDSLLAKQRGSYEMQLPLALAIGPNLPVQVESVQPFRFLVVTHRAAVITNTVCLLIFAVAYLLLIRSPSALRESENGMYSLGKSQMAFWGLLVIISFLDLWWLTGSMERIPEQVLILLGISGATGLGSLMIATSKQGNRPPRPANSTMGKFLFDIIDDGNGISLHRMQVVAWTIILGMVFVKSVNKVMSMPEFPETLLLMMGISNGLYLGFKYPEKVQPPPSPPQPNGKAPQP